MENRAFDHMLGSLALTNSNIDGCMPGMVGCSNPEDPTDPNSREHEVTWNAVYQQIDPHHSIDATTQQIYGVLNDQNEIPKAPYDIPSMRGFIQAYGRLNIQTCIQTCIHSY